MFLRERSVKATLDLLLVPRQNTVPALANWSLANALLALGILVFVVPPMVEVARFNWSTEQGGHGPIVLATGIWLLVREYRQAVDLRRPGNKLIAFGALAVLLPAYFVTGVTGILELQVIVMYLALIVAAYLLFGMAVIRACWFPILYLGFALPPPDTVVAILTQPVKIAISQSAVALLYALGYPVGSSGVVIQIAQYELLVAAACAGLNSLITLSAICLFYVYLRHRHNLRAFVIMSLLVVPVAILANFIRVITLILITYYGGEAAAQGFIHDFAGMVTFAAALGVMLALDSIIHRIGPGSSTKSSVQNA